MIIRTCVLNNLKKVVLIVKIDDLQFLWDKAFDVR